MTNSIAGIILLVVSVAAFNNYQRGTLRQWAESKFLNRSSPAGPGQQLVGLGLGSRAAGGVVEAGGAVAGGVSDIGQLVGQLETWRGVTLDKSAMPSWKRLVLAAEADGVTITGSGWRSNARQRQLRAAHGCPGAKVMDPNCKCSPPTAVPGTSQHEKGLAVDVTNCKTRSTKAFKWLAANAGTYGWKNLPSEPWHWSTTGS